jgi:hypothetical protein
VLSGTQHSADNASGGRRPHTAGSVISMGTSTGAGPGRGLVSFGLSTSAGDMSDMLRRSTVPSANAMSRRLKQASWSSGGSQNVPSFRPGSALAEPHPHAGAVDAANRSTTRRPSTAEAVLPPSSTRLPHAGPTARHRSRSAGSPGASRVRGQQSMRDDKQREDKTGHMQRFLDSMQTVEPPHEDTNLLP